jgi:hypothetical protein
MTANLTPIELASGYVKDDTPLAAQGTWINGDAFRFRQGRAQMRKGRERLGSSTFADYVRGGKSWSDLSGMAWAVFGSKNNLYSTTTAGTITDITPPHSEGVVYDLSDVVSTVAGSGSLTGDSGILYYLPDGLGASTQTLAAAATAGTGAYYYVRNYSAVAHTVAASGADTIDGIASISLPAGTTIRVESDGVSAWTSSAEPAIGPISTVNASPTVTIYHVEHGLAVGQSYAISNAEAVGGLTLSGSYTVVSIISRDKFTITAGSNASSTATGGRFDFIASLVSTSTTDGSIAWSVDNFGEVGICCRTGGPIYGFQPASSYSDLIVSGNFANGTGWSTATRTGTATAGTPSNWSQNIQNAVRGGYTYRAIFVVNRTSGLGSIKLQANAGDPAALIDVGDASAPITVNGTYSRLIVMPANAVDIVIHKDKNWAGTVVWTSLKLENKAFYIQEAPRKNGHAFVDAQGIVHSLGTYEFDGDYNPMVHRWSGVGNFRDWTPATDSMAGEQPLTAGGQLIAGLQGRGQIGIWSDSSFISVQYKGTIGDAFSHTPRGSGCGLMGMQACAEHNGIFFWWSNNGNPYIYQGALPQIIDCRERKDFFDNIASGQSAKVTCYVDSEFSEVGWISPDQRDGTECSRNVAYNWIENHWSGGTFPYTDFLPQGIFPYPVAFGTDQKIYYEGKGATDNGSSRSGFVESSWFVIQNGDVQTSMHGMQVDFQDMDGAQGFNGTCRVRVYGKDRPGDAAERLLTDQSFSDSKIMVWFRGQARLVKVRFDFTGNPCYARFGITGFYIAGTSARR